MAAPLLRLFKRLLLVACFLALGACATGRGSLHRFEYAEIIMGVEARITLFSGDEADARVAARAAFDRMGDLDAVMSDYRRDSELFRVCRAGARRSIPVSADLFDILSRAQEVSAASDGAFDVTIGPLVGLWREARRTGRLPSPHAIAEAQSRTGWRHLVLDDASRAIEFRKDGMRLDLGGIGKGYAADEAIRVLAAAGAPSCLVDLGGDIAAGAPPPGHAAWRIAIASSDSEMTRMFDLAHAAVATSGDVEQHVEIGGVRYSHIVDPTTGLGLANRAQVTVIAPNATTADALASAVSVLGPERGLALIDSRPGAAAMIETWTPSGVQRAVSARFPIALETCDR
jgi:thiamine biosynthesis lipoprotein